MAGLRNILVHDYLEIDNALVHRILSKRLVDFDAFSKQIVEYVERDEP